MQIDENLQSEGHGISNFQTMLSIGLGQDQQFTLILQTLQQLRDVYGESVDKIVQGNTSNIVFLKSTDDSMLDTLQKMSGTKHVTMRDSKTITEDKSRLFWRTNPLVNITISTKEMPVIAYNDMAFIPERNSIVFRAGDSPIWNRNQTILPMSWRLFQNTIIQPGKEYSLQTIPTLSSALDFDVRKNQPDFVAMWEHRRRLAKASKLAQEKYQKAYGLTDFEMAQLDQDDLADELMDVISQMAPEIKVEGNDRGGAAPAAPVQQYEDNSPEMQQAIQEAEQQRGVDVMTKRYAGLYLSRDDLVSMEGGPQHTFDRDFVKAYLDIRGDMERDMIHFLPSKGDGTLRGRDGAVYIRRKSDEELQRELSPYNKAGSEPQSNVYMDGSVKPEDLDNVSRYEVTDEFYRFLVSLDDWSEIANGRFEQAMSQIMDS